jgi:hypothetical protein
MAGTTVYAAKVALETLLTAHTWTGTAPTIQWGQPTEAEDQPFDGIFFGNQPEFTISHRVLGMSRADEEYRLQIVVDVRRYGDDEKTTEQRMWQLFDGVLDVLIANRTLNGAVSHLTDYTVRPGNVPAGALWHSQVVIDLGVVGHIFYP